MPPTGQVTDGRYGLEGRVVTMDATGTLLDRGIVYVHGTHITDVRPSGAAPPSSFEASPVIQTRGTIYPGLIELHNHLAYNALRLWQVPRLYHNRNQWQDNADKKKSISWPMAVLGPHPTYMPAIVRYVEAKCLLAGVTSSQGVTLASSTGSQRLYRGIVRNVEQSTDSDLPAARPRIADLTTGELESFRTSLSKTNCRLLHLSEGTDEAARETFLVLQLSDGSWALGPKLAGIHSLGLSRQDLDTFKQHDAALVWSPLSNLLLYGKTVNVKDAKELNVRMALGSDWSPSGSKNLLGELKVARLVSRAMDGVFSDRELVAMATRNPAEILGWHKSLGSLEAGKRADLLVVMGRQGDPYAQLIEARESHISLVVIDGTPRCGSPRLMEPFGSSGNEEWSVGGARRRLNLVQPDADPIVGALGLGEARDRVTEGLANLVELAREMEPPSGTRGEQWLLVLDQDLLSSAGTRDGRPTARSAVETVTDEQAQIRAAAESKPLSEVLTPLQRDPLTVVDDRTFLDRIAAQPNLPDYVKQGLPDLY